VPRIRQARAGAHAADGMACDALVVGSGAAGLMAAIAARFHGLDVHVVEKAAQVGGCSAYSHGMLWMPCNPVAARAGIADDRNAALAYLRGEMGDRFDAAEIEAFLDHGPRMLEFLERECGLHFELREDFPDYHSERPGAAQRGRTILPAGYDARALGRHLQRLRPPRTTLLGMSFTPAENRLVSSRSPAGLRYLARRLARHLADLACHGRSTRLAGGNALMAGLFKATRDLGIPIHTNAALKELLQEGGRVGGAWIESPGGRWRIHARCGVVLACGGFGQDLARCASWFGHPPLGGLSWSLAPPDCSGDGLRAGLAAGTAAEPVPGNAAFWAPVSRLPPTRSAWGFRAALATHSHDRFRPGFMAVTSEGRRFANEAESNHHFCEALLSATPPGQPPRAWLVCDHQALSTVGLGDAIHGWPFPIGRHLRSGYLLRRDSLAALAEAMQVDPATFLQSVARLNHAARTGHDAEFGKGSSRFNRAMGGTAGSAANPCLRALEHGPFYAVQISVGHMATLAGLRADLHGQALDGTGRAIAGLYLAGNDRANLFRGACPGGGITLAPGMTWAWLTGLHLAGVPATRRHGTAATLPAHLPAPVPADENRAPAPEPQPLLP
jgi:succinate dehydrogenase/fumarate reductase flavoprotein subunit